jgi:hypothetical protein
MHRRTLIAGLGSAAIATRPPGPANARPADAVAPLGAAGRFELVKDWTFGERAGATVPDRAALDRDFRYRYIYNHGTLDTLPTYWSVHRDYPAGDARNLHVFTRDALELRGRISPGGGLRKGGIESGMLRALLPVTPGMYVEMRARLPYGIGSWPSFWLNPGVDAGNGSYSALPWPPEIDIFEFFSWNGRPRPTVMTSNTQSNGRPEVFGKPHDLFSVFHNGEYQSGIDFSEDFHTFALDWVPDEPVWLLDGRAIKRTHYEWRSPKDLQPAPPAHILITNALGMTLPHASVSEMVADENAWRYRIAHLRVWRRA